MLTIVTIIHTMTIAMKKTSFSEQIKLVHSQKSNKALDTRYLLNTQTRGVQENRLRESGLNIGNQRNLITTQMRQIITELMKVNRTILKRRMDGGLFSIEVVDANFLMVLRTSVKPAPMVAMSEKSSNLEETEMHTHWTISIKELKISIHVKKFGSKKTTMKDSKQRQNL